MFFKLSIPFHLHEWNASKQITVSKWKLCDAYIHLRFLLCSCLFFEWKGKLSLIDENVHLLCSEWFGAIYELEKKTNKNSRRWQIAVSFNGWLHRTMHTHAIKSMKAFVHWVLSENCILHDWYFDSEFRFFFSFFSSFLSSAFTPHRWQFGKVNKINYKKSICCQAMLYDVCVCCMYALVHECYTKNSFNTNSNQRKSTSTAAAHNKFT